jgi:hypothetical protein
MADKRVAVILYGADRELWAGSGATLVVRDVNRSDLRVLARRSSTTPPLTSRCMTWRLTQARRTGSRLMRKGIGRPVS